MLTSLASGRWLQRTISDVSRASEAEETEQPLPAMPQQVTAQPQLHEVVEGMLSKLVSSMGEGSRIQLLRNLPCLPKPIRIGTACSGTDVAILGIQAIARILNGMFDVELTCVHAWSCEVDEQKQRFLMDQFDLKCLFADLCSLSSSTAVNLKTNEQEAIPPVDVLVCGFSCKDLSTLKPMANSVGSRDTVLARVVGSSGSTLHGILGFAFAHHPQCIIMENVPNAVRAATNDDEEDSDAEQGTLLKNKEYLVKSFGDIGYYLHINLMNALHQGFPHSRARVYMVAFRKDLFNCDITTRLEQMYLAFPELDTVRLDEFLLCEDECEEWSMKERKRKKRTKATDCGSSKWTTLHNKMFTNAGLSWPPSEQELRRACGRGFCSVPGPFSLHTREAEIVYYTALVKPLSMTSDAEESIDLSQNLDRTAVKRWHVGCLTPGQRIWLRRHQRLLFGEEALRLQGYWRVDKDVRSFTDGELKDLGGNAFCVGSFAISWLVTLSQLQRAP
jgi:site-specific DNA-cytosine methylase